MKTTHNRVNLSTLQNFNTFELLLAEMKNESEKEHYEHQSAESKFVIIGVSSFTRNIEIENRISILPFTDLNSRSKQNRNRTVIVVFPSSSSRTRHSDNSCFQLNTMLLVLTDHALTFVLNHMNLFDTAATMFFVRLVFYV
ncbi:unnamed protein product [Amoebophrya sp. A25]|nr:unnamed protein product [Amoebophrya sp. A25]CAD7945211.1 unnamed protein product [Amoebophrya sp. A25]|eukprot:GSA25T00008055001.1